MKRSTLVLSVTAGLVACVALSAAAVPGARRSGLLGNFPGGAGPVLERVAQRLELTPEQRGEIRAIVLDHAPEVAAALRDVKAERFELFAEIHSHPPIESEIRAASAKVAAAEAELAVARAKLADEIYQTLTPEQQEELRAMEEDLLAMVEAVASRIRDAVEAWLAV